MTDREIAQVREAIEAYTGGKVVSTDDTRDDCLLQVGLEHPSGIVESIMVMGIEQAYLDEKPRPDLLSTNLRQDEWRINLTRPDLLAKYGIDADDFKGGSIVIYTNDDGIKCLGIEIPGTEEINLELVRKYGNMVDIRHTCQNDEYSILPEVEYIFKPIGN